MSEAGFLQMTCEASKFSCSCCLIEKSLRNETEFTTWDSTWL